MENYLKVAFLKAMALLLKTNRRPKTSTGAGLKNKHTGLIAPSNLRIATTAFIHQFVDLLTKKLLNDCHEFTCNLILSGTQLTQQWPLNCFKIRYVFIS